MLSNRLSNSLLAVICDLSTGTFHLKLTPSKSCITDTHTHTRKVKSAIQEAGNVKFYAPPRCQLALP